MTLAQKQASSTETRGDNITMQGLRPFIETDAPEGVRINMHPGQYRAWNSRARVTAVLAGTQGGKTSWGPLWLMREITACHGGDHLAVSANYDLFKLKLLPELQKLFINTFNVGKYWSQEKIIEIRDPDTGKFWARKSTDEMYGRIILRSAKAGSGEVGVRGLESASARSCWADEAGLDDFSLAAWEAINRRLSLSRGRILLTTTLYNFGWLRTQVYLPWTQGDRDIEVVQFDSIENPMFPEEEYYRMKAKMPPWKFDMIYRGVYARPAGQIYNCFDDQRHVRRERIDPIPADHLAKYPIIVGVDPGAVNTSTVWALHNTTQDKITIYRETLEGNMSTAEHCYKFINRAGGRLKEGIQNIRVYGGATSETQFRKDWNTYGVPVQQPRVADVEAGINRVYGYIMEGRMEVMDSCPGLIAQFNEYSRVLDAEGQPTSRIKDKEKYHYLDALRYLASGIMDPRTDDSYTITTSTRHAEMPRNWRPGTPF